MNRRLFFALLLLLVPCSLLVAAPCGDTIVDIDTARILVIDKGAMRLAVVSPDGSVEYSYPMACGKNLGDKQESGDMRTPEGTFSVQSIHNSSWWKHDFRDGKGIIDGAYGPWFIRLNVPGHKGIGIHGTHDSDSMGQRVTEGCIRLRNEDIDELHTLVFPGMMVRISQDSICVID